MVIKRIKARRRDDVEGISGSDHACTPVKSLLALSHPLRHSTIHLATQSRITFGIGAEKDLRDYFLFHPGFMLGR